MIRYFVRTTCERILDRSYEQIKYIPLIDIEHKPVESYIEQLEIISDFDAVLLEDDLILCKDFKKRIEKVIKKYPNQIINFFTSPELYFETHRTEKFTYTQCVYYPKGVINKIIEHMKLKAKFYTQYDYLEYISLVKAGIPVISYRPCLVQHIDNKSLIQKGKGRKRRCIYFIDYLDELGIDYKDAFKNNNRERLKEKLEESFRKDDLNG